MRRCALDVQPDFPNGERDMTAVCTDYRTRSTMLSTADLLEAVRQGDDLAWQELMDRYVRLLWTVTHSCRLSEHDAQDVIQTTWVKLVENLDRIREPEYLHQWLAVTARRECWRLSARSRKAPGLLPEEVVQSLPSTDEPLDAELLRREERARLWAAVAELPEVQQRVVRALSSASEPTYDEIAQELGVPRGSLGPTRHRALRRLRVLLHEDMAPRSTGCVVPRSRPHGARR
jgi:RNA polymerase sigma factor (sigma-70 family)